MGQVAMVIDLNKCIGCQTCTTACKSLWTDEPGQEYMLWNNVETKPGPGYPRYWEEGGGGFDDQGNLKRDGLMPKKIMERKSHSIMMKFISKALKLGFNKKSQ